MSGKILLGILIKDSVKLHKKKTKCFIIRLKVSSCSWVSVRHERQNHFQLISESYNRYSSLRSGKHYVTKNF